MPYSVETAYSIRLTKDNSNPFLDMKFTRKEDGTSKSTVHRKQTHC